MDVIGKPIAYGGNQKVGARSADRFVVPARDHFTVITKTGQVFVHMLVGSEVKPAYQLATASPVGANGKDEHVFEMEDRIVVVTSDGDVFVHDVVRPILKVGGFDTLGNPKSVSAPRRINGSVRVAANPQDEHVLLIAGKIVVITTDGGVFGHDIDLAKGTVGAPFRFGPTTIAVAANSQDEHVLAWWSRILVVTRTGEVFAHDLNGRTIGAPYQLGPVSIKVAALPQDDKVLALPDRLEIAVITRDGSVFGHAWKVLAPVIH